MKIEVTQEDIQKGKKGNSCACPVWHAGNRAGLIDFEVWNRSVVFVHNGQDARCLLPESVQTFIKKFDCGQPVEPISFDLEVEGIENEADNC